MSKLYLKFTVLSFILATAALTAAAQGIGSWTSYAAYHNSTYNVSTGDKVYVLFDGALLSYTVADGEVQTFSKVDALSDDNISFIAWNEAQKKLLVVYSDANVDLIYADGTVRNMSELKDKIISNKTVTSIWMDGSNAYMATHFGVVVVNMQKEEFSTTYEFNSTVRSCVKNGDVIYVSTDAGLYAGDTKNNLLDKSNWTKVGSFAPTSMVVFDGKLYGLQSDGLYRCGFSDATPEKLSGTVYTYLNLSHEVLVAGNSTAVRIYTSGSAATDITGVEKFNYFSYGGDGTYWASKKLGGLQAYKLNTADHSIATSGLALTLDSPIRNYFSYMTYTPQNALLVAGGSHNYSDKYYEGTLMKYADGKWQNFQEDSISSVTGRDYVNLTSIVEDPSTAGHYFASSMGQGIYEYTDGKFVKNYNADNSGLASILPQNSNRNDYVRVNGLTYDKLGNLWMLNNEVDTVIKVFQADKTWKRVFVSALKGNPTMDQLLFDNRGWIWINSRRLITGLCSAGVCCIQYNGDLSAINSDAVYYRGSIINQDGVTYNPTVLYCLAEDKNGYIWVGTNLGPFLIDSPTKFGDSSFSYTQVKVPRNDGSQYADYLLSGVSITSIAVDGGNRKWFGTESNGVYLVGSDNITTIHHFTKDNSPLPSDAISSIAVNGATGEVMIGTDAGLVSYMADATEAAETLDKNNIHAYPNPVKPDYEGVITVVGLTSDSEVQITTATGQLVAQGTSIGGTFTWNGKNASGKRVSSGVYNVLAVTSDGKKGIVTKVVMIK
jgi:hypothetical protein